MLMLATEDRKTASRKTRRLATFALLTAVAAIAACGLLVASAGDGRAGQGAVVQNVRTERMGGSVVRIVYDLFAADPSVSVEVKAEASVDGGRTYGVKPKSVMGDVGKGVKPGMGKSILWDVLKDLGEVKFELIKAKISLDGDEKTIPPPVPAEPVAPPPPARGTIVVTSQPPDANVTVDGTWRGVTPSEIREWPGVHRVLVTKPGYLDNARTVDVRSGASEVVDIRLTPLAPPPPPPVTAAPAPAPTPASPSQPQVQPKKKGSPVKWILIGAGALTVGGVGVAAATGVFTPNKAPIAGSVTVSPTGTGLMAATVFSFTASGASDPDGDPITYSWNFGDSGTGTGATATHVYATAGTFAVTLTVSDGKKSATATANVTVRDVTGTWTGNIGCGTVQLRFVLSQSGSNITGTYSDNINGSGPTTGTVTNPRAFSWQTSIPGFSTGNWSGTVGSDATTISGSVTWFTCGTTPFNLTRQ